MLDVKNISAGYDKMLVIRDISLSVAAGEILLITGENGAGKSTLLRTLAGFIRPVAGSIRFNGQEIAGREPEVVASFGLRLVLDGHRVFPEVSVYDNLRLGAALRKADRSSFEREVEEVYSVFPILREKRADFARDLSGGQQQMLALGQAFVAQPTLLLCDEPSLGLAQSLLPPIMAFLKKWAERGTAIVIVEQHVDIALSTADRALLMRRGEIVKSFAAGELDAASFNRAVNGLPDPG